MRGFSIELTASTEAYLKAARAHGDPGRLAAFFQKLLRGGSPANMRCPQHAAESTSSSKLQRGVGSLADNAVLHCPVQHAADKQLSGWQMPCKTAL